jgi:hypothetical protein
VYLETHLSGVKGQLSTLNDRRGLDDTLLAEDMSLEEVWKPNPCLVRDELLGRDRKDL